MTRLACWAAVAVCLGVASTGGQAARADDSVKPNPDHIRHLIQMLDSDHYTEREVATRQLIAAGTPAVGPVANAAQTGSAEVSWRSVRVLQQLAVCGDASVEPAAESALESLVDASRRSVAERAQRALTDLQESRHARAVERIKQLGGKLYADSTNTWRLTLDGSWRGGEADLVHIKRLQNLDSVNIEPEAGVSFKQADKLREQLAGQGVKVLRFGGAYLGVMGNIHEPSMRVSQVIEQSGAYHAGVRDGDVIVRINDHDIKDFEALVNVIGRMKPGEKVALRYTRNGQLLSGTGVLGRRAKAMAR